MILFPAIDLIAGKVVRLERGDREHMKVYSDDPAAVARSFAEQGATWVHVVDLSAALEEDEEARGANTRAIEAICAVEGLSVDIGGGVRSLARIDELAALGCKRIWCASRGLPRWQPVRSEACWLPMWPRAMER